MVDSKRRKNQKEDPVCCRKSALPTEITCISANIRHLKIISLLEKIRRSELTTKRELKFFNLKPSAPKVLAYEKTGAPGPKKQGKNPKSGSIDPLKEKWLILRLHSAGRLTRTYGSTKTA